MAVFTCEGTSTGNLELRHPFSTHMHEAAITSPFLHYPSVSPSDGLFKSTMPHLILSPRVASPCVSSGSDTKTFYTAIELSDFVMQQPKLSPALSDLGSTSPDSPLSTDGVQDDAKDSRCLIRTSTYPLDPSHDLPLSRESSCDETKYEHSSSRTSSCSNSRRRSTSRSTRSRSSPGGRRRGSHRPNIKPGTYGQIPSQTLQRVDSMIPWQAPRDLLSLHRDSCRLFEESGAVVDSKVEKGSQGQQQAGSQRHNAAEASSKDRDSLVVGEHPTRVNTVPMQHFSTLIGQQIPRVPATSSPSASPLLKSRPPQTHPFNREADSSPVMQDHCHWDPINCGPVDTIPNADSQTLQAYKPSPVTVIDWTTASTRRREYAKIDRSSRGVRGMWRRFAPSWCQSGERRTLFFEEGKGGKEMYEDSVRRFRIDVPDDGSTENEKPQSLMRTLTVNRFTKRR